MDFAQLLEGKKVLVGITGSISAYKTLELIRHFTKSGAQVRIVVTPSALRFVTPLVLETLSGHKILSEDTENWHSDHNHIGVATWADVFVIAPCTANTLNKLSNGIADTLLTQTALAFTKPIVVAPAANSAMMGHVITQASLKLLKLSNVTLIHTQTKELACKTVGDGALADVLEIFYVTARALLSEAFWTHRRVVVTGGGTKEPIDDVRAITNASSGKMAASLALALYFKGAEVCFISSTFAYTLPHDMCTMHTPTASQMHSYLEDALKSAKKGFLTQSSLIHDNSRQLVQKTPFLFMAAAVADYKVKFAQKGKLKKSALGSTWNLELVQNEDILASIDKDNLISVAFKAELDAHNAHEHAKKLLDEKHVNAVCLNIIDNQNPFGSNTNSITFLTPTTQQTIPTLPKLHVAQQICDYAQSLDNS